VSKKKGKHHCEALYAEAICKNEQKKKREIASLAPLGLRSQ
jgi:hypothetical protein